jgi:hypothetical protein
VHNEQTTEHGGARTIRQHQMDMIYHIYTYAYINYNILFDVSTW